MKKLLLAVLLMLTGCVRIPDNVSPVSGFELKRYLGTWYEIARLDHSFERGLTRVSAQYSVRGDGGVRVLNRGYDAAKGKWKEAEGKARFARSSGEGFLKVSFFGPFYGSYIIVELDKENYDYALVCGPDKSYLWILSRMPVMDSGVKSQLVLRAAELGFDTDKLMFVEQGE
jgi:apolipoprotein D and lipocalin family protein